MKYTFNSSVFVAEEFDGDYILLNSLTGKYYELADKAALFLKEILAGADAFGVVGDLRDREAESLDDAFLFVSTLEHEKVLIPGEATATKHVDDQTLAALGTSDGTFLFEGFEDIAPFLLADPVHDVDLLTGQIASLGGGGTSS